MSPWLFSASIWSAWGFGLLGCGLLAVAAANAHSAETRPRATLLAIWAFPSFALAFLAFNLWAIAGDIDNLEYGLRPERLGVAGVAAGAALVLATIITLRSRRVKPRSHNVAA